MAARSLAALLCLAAAGCVESQLGDEPVPTALAYPTGIAVAEGDRPLLLVVSSNFDLRYRAGLLHAFDLEAFDAAAAGAAGGAEPGRPADVADFAGTLLAAVEIGDFGGEIGVADLGGARRAFVPVRGEDAVVAVDIAADGSLSCANGGGRACKGTGVDFPRDDPYSVAVVGRNVYVTHASAPQFIGVLGAATIDDPIWTGEPGELSWIVLGSTAGGGVVGRCQLDGTGTPDCRLGGRVFVAGRSLEEFVNPLFTFAFDDGHLFGPLHVVNAFYEHRGLDGRGLALSPGHELLYAVTRQPDAVATVDLTELAAAAPAARVAPAGGPAAGPPRRAAGAGPGPAPRPARPPPPPRGPTTVAAIPRPGGGPDLLAVTSTSGLSFVDGRTGLLSAHLAEVGRSPSAIAARARPGAATRLYVPSFTDETISVIDVPDPLDPRGAHVVAPHRA